MPRFCRINVAAVCSGGINAQNSDIAPPDFAAAKMDSAIASSSSWFSWGAVCAVHARASTLHMGSILYAERTFRRDVQLYCHPHRLVHEGGLSEGSENCDTRGVRPNADPGNRVGRRHAGGIDEMPCPVEIDFSHRMKVWRSHPRGVNARKSGRDGRCARQGDHDMCIVAAYALALNKAVEGRRLCVA